MAGIRSQFDCEAFYRALDVIRLDKKLNWKQLGAVCSVSASTLTRMGQGKRPDADSLAMLSAWSGLNPANFVNDASVKSGHNDTLPQIMTYLRADPNLTQEAVEALEGMIVAAYGRLKKTQRGEDTADAEGIQS